MVPESSLQQPRKKSNWMLVAGCARPFIAVHEVEDSEHREYWEKLQALPETISILDLKWELWKKEYFSW